MFHSTASCLSPILRTVRVCSNLSVQYCTSTSEIDDGNIATVPISKSINDQIPVTFDVILNERRNIIKSCYESGIGSDQLDDVVANGELRKL